MAHPTTILQKRPKVYDLNHIKRFVNHSRPPTADNIIAQIRFDEPGAYCFTPLFICDDISAVVKAEITKLLIDQPQHVLTTVLNKLIITDITAGIGGSAVGFSAHFNQVNCIEKNMTTCDMLRHNLRVFGVTNANIICGTCKIAANYTHHAVFFDPPWGGPTYKGRSNIRLTLSDNSGIYSIEHMINLLSNVICVVKLPYNYDIDYLTATVRGEVIKTVGYDRPFRTLIVYIRCGSRG